MRHVLRMTGEQHAKLSQHLFPGDGKEAVALLLCGRRCGANTHALSVREVVPVPHAACDRSRDHVTWPTDALDDHLEACRTNGWGIVKAHSHPTGYPQFSDTDDRSDKLVYEGLTSLLDDGLPHASIVMKPDGSIFGRVIDGEGNLGLELELIEVVGDEIGLFFAASEEGERGFERRHSQAFGKGTVSTLSQLSAAVVGCSGTGSVVIELLSRLGIRRLVLIDPDVIEEHNLNRIINSRREDADACRSKVSVIADALRRTGLVGEVSPLQANLATVEAIQAVAECDVLFGCMDSVEGRHWLNRIATFYSLPYFDVGVRLDADGTGGINSIAGAVHYLQPGRSSLLSRGLYSMQDVDAESMRRVNPGEYQRRVGEGYLRGVAEDRPAVVSVNTFFASMMVNEFLARIHPYRNLDNAEYAVVQGNLSEVQLFHERDGEPCRLLSKHVGRGDCAPLLDRPGMN